MTASYAAGQPPLASLSLTHVYYSPEDPLSLVSAWLALLPQAMMIVYLACEAANFVLKRIIREERPKLMHGKGYGMPSSHAQFSAFFALYLVLLLLRRNLGGGELPGWRRAVYAVAAVTGSVAVAASRVYLNYHTPKQVVVGYAAGLVCALGWYAVTSAARTIRGGKLWDAMLGLGACLWIRDRCLKVDLVVAGWNAARNGTEKKKR
ncbi:phosphatidic acid phosphatase type 2/haloperoxidase [Sphaerosporella brunnea]|uniref:Dolichyldiphosphatase n=1 Tax=Sphaerosporella brunnea TaxID=1250544 RepID=A0A5J5EY01_9PEZI|nr:phosphatidic acid phosphatase type 2/haloperoxidase [Sphaerosporella brunnea]